MLQFLPASQTALLLALTRREGVFSGLHTLMDPKWTHSAASSVQVERKIETMITAPAAVDDALASLIVDHPNPILQTRALSTYIRRIYYPYLLSEPLVARSDQVLCAAWLYEEPLMAQVGYEQPAVCLQQFSHVSLVQ